MRCVLLRRPKSSIQLPPRHGKECGLVFSAEEAKLYEETRSSALKTLENAFVSGAASTKAYCHVLGQINTLRMLCNLGTHYQPRKSRSSSGTRSQDWTDIAQDTFNSLLEIGNLFCSDCGLNVEEYGTYSQSRSVQPIYLSSCMRIICPNCQNKCTDTSLGFRCGHESVCPSAPVSFSGAPCDADFTVNGPLPTKIIALVSQLKNLEMGVKR